MDDTTRRNELYAKLNDANANAGYPLQGHEFIDALDRLSETTEPIPERALVDVLREKSRLWRRGVMRW